jgi:hypothetical protein
MNRVGPNLYMESIFVGSHFLKYFSSLGFYVFSVMGIKATRLFVKGVKRA